VTCEFYKIRNAVLIIYAVDPSILIGFIKYTIRFKVENWWIYLCFFEWKKNINKYAGRELDMKKISGRFAKGIKFPINHAIEICNLQFVKQ
jgi:hypothetical protein